MTHPTGDALRAASTGPRALLASLTDEEAEAVVTLARMAEQCQIQVWNDDSIDAQDVDAIACRLKLIHVVPYDPDRHEDALGLCPAEGDDWSEWTPAARSAIAKLRGEGP